MQPRPAWHGGEMRVDRDDLLWPGPVGTQLRPQVRLSSTEERGECPAVTPVGQGASFDPAAHGLWVHAEAGGDVFFGQPGLEQGTAEGFVQARGLRKCEVTTD